MWDKTWCSSKYWISCNTNNDISTIDFLNSQPSVRSYHYSLHRNSSEKLNSYHKLVYSKCNSYFQSLKITESVHSLKYLQENRFRPSATSVQACITSECLSIVQISFANPIHKWKMAPWYSSTFLNLWHNNHSKFSNTHENWTLYYRNSKACTHIAHKGLCIRTFSHAQHVHDKKKQSIPGKLQDTSN